MYNCNNVYCIMRMKRMNLNNYDDHKEFINVNINFDIMALKNCLAVCVDERKGSSSNFASSTWGNCNVSVKRSDIVYSVFTLHNNNLLILFLLLL